MFFPLISNRRSIRKFTDQPLSAETIERLQEGLLWAPSSRGRNPWQFVFVTERETLQALGQTRAHSSQFLAGAALAVVICADPEVADTWIEDCAIAATYLQLSAAELGLGSCWCQIRIRQHDEQTSAADYVRRLLDIPEQLEITAVIGIGHPDEKKPGHARAALPWDKIHIGRFGSKD